MDNIIMVQKMSCCINDKKILDNISFNITKGSFVSIVGPSGSGKSILVKALLGLIPYEGYANVCRMNVCRDNISEIRKNIGIVFENPDNYFVIDTVEDELVFTLENLNISPSNIKKKLDEIVSYLKIEHLLNKNVNQLSGGEKQLIALASVLITEPKVLILDQAFTMLDGESHKNLLSVIKKIHQEKKMTIINVTLDMNDTVYSDQIIVLNKGQVLFDDTKEQIYKEDKKLRSIGLNLPFLADLSKKLSYYDLLDDIVLNMNTMVKKLWK